jgi:hypothetical protein
LPAVEHVGHRRRADERGQVFEHRLPLVLSWARKADHQVPPARLPRSEEELLRRQRLGRCRNRPSIPVSGRSLIAGLLRIDAFGTESARPAGPYSCRPRRLRCRAA